MTPVSGVAVDAGIDRRDKAELYLDEIHHRMAGKKVELVAEDSESSPVTATGKVLKLCQHDKCQILDGFLLGNVGHAVLPTIDKMKVPTVYAVASCDVSAMHPLCSREQVTTGAARFLEH